MESNQCLSLQQVDEEYEFIDEKMSAFMLQNLTETQLQLVQQMSQLVKQNYPRSSEAIHSMVQFLRARNWNLQNAYALYTKRMDWVAKEKPHKITEEDVKESWISRKVEVLNQRGKNGEAILIIRGAKHYPTKQEDLWKFVMFVMESARRVVFCSKDNEQFEAINPQVIVIWDRSNVTRKNFDVSNATPLSKFGDYYPEFLKQVYILYPNWLLNIGFAVIKPFLDKHTVDKISIVKDWNLDVMCKTMQDTIPIDQIPREFIPAG